MKITVCTPTFNEKDNILKLCSEIRETFNKIQCDYEHLIIDNNLIDTM